MLRFFFASFILSVASVLALAGFRGTKSAKPPIQIFPDMDNQPKYMPQHGTGFYGDGRSARQPVAGTIPLGYTLEGRYFQAGAKNATVAPSGFTNKPDYLHTGKFGDVYGDGFPVEVTEAFLKRGQQRYDINCAVCHGKAGLGNGVVGQFGVVAIANLLDDRIRQQPDGQIFSTITNGKNTMGAYGPNIAIEDRWAIVAYVRALQKSQSLQLAQLPEARRKEIEAKP